MSTPKKLLIAAALVTIIFQAQSQGVGIGVESPNPNAVLELVSPDNNQGLLVPKMSTAERTATAFTDNLSSSENGLLVYDTDENAFYFWINSQWVSMQSAVNVTAGSGIQIIDGEISNTGDLDSSNEIQDLELDGNTLRITNNTSATDIDLTPLTENNTDEQILSLSGTTCPFPVETRSTSVASIQILNSLTLTLQDLATSKQTQIRMNKIFP